MANDFLNFYRSTFMGQRDQVNAEKKAAQAEEKAQKAAVEAEEAKEKVKVGAFFTNLRESIKNAVKEAADAAENTGASQGLSQPGATAYDTDSQTYYYTYKPGDTFGQVIKNLGLESGNGLWGENGDVAYYTQQLIDQGVWEDGVPHDIPIGTTIKLRHRNAPAITMSQPAGKMVQEAKYPALQQIIRSGERKV